MRKLAIMLGMSAMLLAACGGSSTSLRDAATSTTGTTTTGTGTGTGTTTAATTLSLGSGSGASFEAGAIAVSTKSLSAGGSTSLQVSLVNQAGAPYTTATAITFNSPCVGQGLAKITATGSSPASATITTSTGVASATYVAAGCSGSDVISATATANSQSLAASATVTVAQAAIGSISFVSATPSNITLKGVGSAGGSATSTIVFKVLDTSGGPRSNASVTFALNTTVGGITIAPTSAVTDANGQVQTIVSGGTVATTVRVTASTVAGSSTISTESNSLTVSTGIPSSHNISLAVGSATVCPNVEAWDRDNVTVPVLLSMTDRFSNPVPDGTTANFQTTLGGIQGTCQTGPPTAASGSGQCSINWTSKAPYTVNGNPQSTTGNANTSPAYCPTTTNPLALCNGTTNGRSPIFATAIGEESFIDANGNGIFDPADTVAFDAADTDNNFANGKPKPWQDTSEPFLNEWEIYDGSGTPTFIPGEPFIDFNSNGQHDGPDGLFNGPLCEGPLCSTTQTSVAIGANNVIVLSGSNANLTVLSPASGPPYNFSANGLVLQVEIYDDRLQQMPGGTTVTATVSTGSTATITSPAPGAWPCTTAPPYVDGSGNIIAGKTFVFTLAPSTASPQVGGYLIISVTTPLKLVTTFSIPIA